MKRLIFLLSCVIFLCSRAVAHTTADDAIDITFFMAYTDKDGEDVMRDWSLSEAEEGTLNIEEGQEAPFPAEFYSVISNANEEDVFSEWNVKIQRNGSALQEDVIIHRSGTSLEFTFKESGTYYVKNSITIKGDGQNTEGYEIEATYVFSIVESKLELPNAFTPNGDGINDVFKVKDGYKSIVEFKAMVFSRSGKKLYEWTDPADGWDGTMNGAGGTDAPDGAYYLVVKARGADGIKYDRKMTINLLRGYNKNTQGI